MLPDADAVLSGIEDALAGIEPGAGPPVIWLPVLEKIAERLSQGAAGHGDEDLRPRT